MGTFNNYRTCRELADLCHSRQIDLQPLVDHMELLAGDASISGQDAYNELLGQMGTMSTAMAPANMNMAAQKPAMNTPAAGQNVQMMNKQKVTGQIQQVQNILKQMNLGQNQIGGFMTNLNKMIQTPGAI